METWVPCLQSLVTHLPGLILKAVELGIFDDMNLDDQEFIDLRTKVSILDDLLDKAYERPKFGGIDKCRLHIGQEINRRV